MKLFPHCRSADKMFNVPVLLTSTSTDTTQTKTDHIVHGARGKSFRTFLTDLLRLTRLKQKYIDRILEHHIATYDKVFTHITADPHHNYEFYEIMGDVTANKCVVWYISERFPQLRNTSGVKVIARLRINLVSKKNFSNIAESMGFNQFISYAYELKDFKNKSILEDVFEAFIGATESIIDEMCGVGSGYSVCYRFMKTVLDRIHISLKYEDLYDPITRLKETFDHFRAIDKMNHHIWGSLKWENTRHDDKQHVYLYQIDPNQPKRRMLMASFVAATLDEAKQSAALIALEDLNSKGVFKPVNEYYKTIA